MNGSKLYSPGEQKIIMALERIANLLERIAGALEERGQCAKLHFGSEEEARAFHDFMTQEIED